jgi:hypothetical protein
MLFNKAEFFLNGRDFLPRRPKNLERVGSAEIRQFRGLSVAKIGKPDYCKICPLKANKYAISELCDLFLATQESLRI